MNKILVIYAHPEAPTSRVNRALRQGAQLSLAGAKVPVTWHDLYQHYPDFHIGVAQEQALLLEHDILVFQHPLYWYSTPALLKHWLDEVLLDGWAYGVAGGQRKALQGKLWGHWITAGGSASAYTPMQNNDGLTASRASIEQYLLPWRQSALLCGCQWLNAQVSYSSLVLTDEDLELQAELYAAWLNQLARLDLSEPISATTSQGASYA